VSLLCRKGTEETCYAGREQKRLVMQEGNRRDLLCRKGTEETCCAGRGQKKPLKKASQEGSQSNSFERRPWEYAIFKPFLFVSTVNLVLIKLFKLVGALKSVNLP
jgi:hypothetical protein